MPVTDKSDAPTNGSVILPEKLSLSSIAHRCARETAAFFGRRSHDPRFCFELFRRAIVERIERAWSLVYEQYSPLVVNWVRRHPAFATCGEEAQFIVNRAFDRMWSALTPDRFASFPNLKSILRYLQMCVNSVLVDQVRRQQVPQLSLDDPETPPPPATDGGPYPYLHDGIYRQEFWRSILTRLKDEQEVCIVYASFVEGLKPREICAHYDGLFTNVRQVYRVKENVMARLRRDRELHAMLVGDA